MGLQIGDSIQARDVWEKNILQLYLFTESDHSLLAGVILK